MIKQLESQYQIRPDHRDTNLDKEYKEGSIDHFGHLSYRHFLHYFDQSREALLGSLGLNNKQLLEQGLTLTVKKVEIEYHYELLPLEEITVETILDYNGGNILITNQNMYLLGENERKLAATVTIKSGFARLENGNRISKPIKPPKELVSKIKEHQV